MCTLGTHHQQQARHQTGRHLAALLASCSQQQNLLRWKRHRQQQSRSSNCTQSKQKARHQQLQRQGLLLQWQPHRLHLHARRASGKLQWQHRRTGQLQALQRLAASVARQLL
jgi:hypothetical protein